MNFYRIHDTGYLLASGILVGGQPDDLVGRGDRCSYPHNMQDEVSGSVMFTRAHTDRGDRGKYFKVHPGRGWTVFTHWCTEYKIRQC